MCGRKAWEMSKAMDMLERRVDELERKLEEAEAEADFNNNVDMWWWRRSREPWPDRGDLPVPRLEMVWQPNGGERAPWASCEALYVLVYRHLLGHLVGVPMGRTKRDGSGQRPYHGDTPFRDGAHIRHDAEHMGLPAFVVIDERDGSFQVSNLAQAQASAKREGE